MGGDSKGPMGHPDHVSERTIAITGGDAGYFDLIEDCVGSLRAAAEGRALALGILDCGLTEAQRAWCRDQGATLVVPQWDFDFPGRDKLKDGYKALTARPFLPRYFPGFDLYLWIDGDCWVQQGDAIALFQRAARTGALAVAPEIHRSMRHYRHAWGEFSSINGAAYEACFDKETAERLIRYPLINAGVFALKADAPRSRRDDADRDPSLHRKNEVTLDVVKFSPLSCLHSLVLPSYSRRSQSPRSCPARATVLTRPTLRLPGWNSGSHYSAR